MARGFGGLAQHGTEFQLHGFGYGEQPQPVPAWKQREQMIFGDGHSVRV